MKQYRGYYIDHVIFNSERDIDSFIREQNIESYKRLCVMFANDPSMEINVMMCDKYDYLHNYCGMSFEEIEEIEISVFKAS